MTQIAFLLMCHKTPDLVLDQARVLSSSGDCVVIHGDLNAGPAFRAQLTGGIVDLPGVALAPGVRCGWGEWSLVQATLNMIRTAYDTFPDASHFFLMSGDCMPIKSARYMHAALAANDRDFIQHADFYEDGWIKTGLTDERLIYRHWFNERTQKALFYRSLDLQRKLGLSRNLPRGIKPKIGSQWWLLRRSTIERILAFIAERRDVVRFFKTTWIPDETFFQTLVMHLVAREEVEHNSPTFLMFSDYGKPLTFYADHYEMLRGQWQFAARKISQNDVALRERLGQLFQSDDNVEGTDNAGQTVYEYVRQRGRAGTRYAQRIWEAGARLGPDYDLTVILCKKWHIGNRIADALGQIGDRRTFGYVFDEEAPSLPHLGGFSKGRDKRARHRRAFLQLLGSSQNTRRLAICLDPSNLDAIADFVSDGCSFRVLDIGCRYDHDWIEGHAERIGLGTRASNGAMHDGVLLSLANQIDEERTRLRDMRLPHHERIDEGQNPGQMARPIANALDIPIDDAARIARMDDLFQ